MEVAGLLFFDPSLFNLLYDVRIHIVAAISASCDGWVMGLFDF